MNTFEILRATYRRLRGVPYIGPLAEAVRYRKFPAIASAKKKYEQQQALIEAHGHALSGLRQALAMLSETIAQEQAHHLNLRFDAQNLALMQQFEQQRNELLFELRYSTTGLTSSPGLHTKPETARIINTPKLDAQRAQGALRLNVGCGHKPETERLNVDMRELPGVDIVATVDQLPFVMGELHEIFSSHVLEHFPLEQLRRQLLPAWVRLLRPGGELRAIVPDAHAMLQAHAQGDLDFETLRLITFGGQEYEGDFHHTMFSPHSLTALLTEVGLTDIRVEASGRRNGLCLEFEIVGTKP